LGIENLNEMQEAAGETILNDITFYYYHQPVPEKHWLFIANFEMLPAEILSVQCLILVPSRNWDCRLNRSGKNGHRLLKSMLCYGGHSIDTEIKNLSNPPAVYRNAGRIADHIDRGTFRVDKIQTLILDDSTNHCNWVSDEQMSFIIERLPKLNKRVLVFSDFGHRNSKIYQSCQSDVLDYYCRKKRTRIFP